MIPKEELWEVMVLISKPAIFHVIDEIRDGRANLDKWSVQDAEKLEQAAELIRKHYKSPCPYIGLFGDLITPVGNNMEDKVSHSLKSQNDKEK